MKKEMVKINGFNVTMSTENNTAIVTFLRRQTKTNYKKFMFKLNKEQFEQFSNFGKRIIGIEPATIKTTGKAVNTFLGTTEWAPEYAVHKELYDGEVELQIINTITNNIIVATYTAGTSKGTRSMSFSACIDIDTSDIEKLSKRINHVQSELV